MMDKWGRMDTIHQRLLTHMPVVELKVFVASETYDTADGFEATFSEHSESPVDANPTTPDSDRDKEEHGTGQQFRNQFLVPEDLNVSWEGYGEAAEASMEVVDQRSDERYRVQEVENLHNGLIRLAGASVDD
jgi:hypothetical protein